MSRPFFSSSVFEGEAKIDGEEGVIAKPSGLALVLRTFCDVAVVRWDRVAFVSSVRRGMSVSRRPALPANSGWCSEAVHDGGYE